MVRHWTGISAGPGSTPPTRFLLPSRHSPDRVDQIAQVVGFCHGRLPAVLQERPRFPPRLIPRYEDEPLGHEWAAVHQLLVHRATAEAWHLEIGDDGVVHIVAVAEALHRFE